MWLTRRSAMSVTGSAGAMRLASDTVHPEQEAPLSQITFGPPAARAFARVPRPALSSPRSAADERQYFMKSRLLIDMFCSFPIGYFQQARRSRRKNRRRNRRRWSRQLCRMRALIVEAVLFFF